MAPLVVHGVIGSPRQVSLAFVMGQLAFIASVHAALVMSTMFSLSAFVCWSLSSVSGGHVFRSSSCVSCVRVSPAPISSLFSPWIVPRICRNLIHILQFENLCMVLASQGLVQYDLSKRYDLLHVVVVVHRSGRFRAPSSSEALRCRVPDHRRSNWRIRCCSRLCCTLWRSVWSCSLVLVTVVSVSPLLAEMCRGVVSITAKLWHFSLALPAAAMIGGSSSHASRIFSTDRLFTKSTTELSMSSVAPFLFAATARTLSAKSIACVGFLHNGVAGK